MRSQASSQWAPACRFRSNSNACIHRLERGLPRASLPHCTSNTNWPVPICYVCGGMFDVIQSPNIVLADRTNNNSPKNFMPMMTEQCLCCIICSPASYVGAYHMILLWGKCTLSLAGGAGFHRAAQQPKYFLRSFPLLAGSHGPPDSSSRSCCSQPTR